MELQVFGPMRRGGPLARARAISSIEPDPEAAVLQQTTEYSPEQPTETPFVSDSSFVVVPPPLASNRNQGVSSEPPTEVIPEAALPQVVTGAVPKRKAVTPRVRYYICTKVPLGREDLLGLYHCTWAEVLAALPDQKLIGSGCVVSGFDSEREAIHRWVDRGWELPCPLKTQ